MRAKLLASFGPKRQTLLTKTFAGKLLLKPKEARAKILTNVSVEARYPGSGFTAKDFGPRAAPPSARMMGRTIMEEAAAKKNTSQIPQDKVDAALALALDASRRMDAAVSEMRSALAELRSDFNALRSELREDFNALRVEVKGDIQSLRTEIREEIQSLRMSVDNRFNQLQGHINIWLMVLTAVIALFALFAGFR